MPCLARAPVLSLVVVLWAFVGRTRQLSCSEHPAVYRGQTSGNISMLYPPEPGYPDLASCAWLIIADGENETIRVQFQSLDTECGADFVYVFDGAASAPPYGGRLLGSFSGNTLPDVLTSASNSVAIYFTSDVSYGASGFALNFIVVPKSILQAQSSITGIPLDPPPNSLGSSAGSSCDPQWNVTQAKWLVLSQPLSALDSGLSARAGHGAVWCPLTQSLFVFGGDATNGLLYNDLWIYSMITDTWTQMSGAGEAMWPAARHRHRMAYVSGGNMYVYGGLLADGKATAELWHFSTQLRRWTVLPSGPYGVSGHTLTVVDDRWIYVVGGAIQNNSITGDVYRYAAGSNPSAGAWEKVALVGSWPSVPATGHSAVYDAATRSLLIFGGYYTETSRFVRTDSSVYTIQVDNRHLSRLNTGAFGAGRTKAPAVAFHTATVIGRYMAVYGGMSINAEEKCFDAGVHLYHMGCHKWIDPFSLEKAVDDSLTGSNGYTEATRDKGRAMHAAAVAYGNMLLIVGGYRGNVLRDLIAYVVPRSVAHFKCPGSGTVDPAVQPYSTNECGTYKTKDSCGYDPECSWCRSMTSSASYCTSRRATAPAGFVIDQTLMDTCPGICGFLKTCTSCAMNGDQWASDLPQSGLVPPPLGSGCVWCVPSQSCLSSYAYSEDSSRLCRAAAWWVSMPLIVRTASMCRLDDRPPGLYVSVLKTPPDPAHPDEVFLLQTTSFRWLTIPIDYVANCSLCSIYSDDCERCYNMMATTGYIHEPLLQSSQQVHYELDVTKSMALFYIYCNGAQVRASAFEKMTATSQAKVISWPAERTCPNLDGRSLLGGQRRRFTLNGMALQLDDKVIYPVTTYVLRLINSSTSVDDLPLSLTSDYLEAYASDNCSAHATCLACVSDMSCGWCPLVDSCFGRANSSNMMPELCGGSRPDYWLIVNPVRCSYCNQSIDCQSCASSRYCEWLPDNITCMRRGRFKNAIRDASRCPSICRLRTNCTQCLAYNDQCIWCSDTIGCISQLELQTTYIYGQCRTWTENYDLGNRKTAAEKCPSCSKSRTCVSCLGEASLQSRGSCGWCYNVTDPTHGVCVIGDFAGPLLPLTTAVDAPAGAADRCKALMAASLNTTISTAVNWAFAECPDVDECTLGYSNCSKDASCSNTAVSFSCQCHQGFNGSGYWCERTCNLPCMYGKCSGEPDYVCLCELGWYGPKCAQDCGCNNLSTCLVSGPGQCDQCQRGSVGAECKACPQGMTWLQWPATGCGPCQCNGHGDTSRDLCNSSSGVCFCVHNTQGNHCEECRDDYYGDPRDGGVCYLGYNGRTVLTGLSGTGAIGTVLSRNLFMAVLNLSYGDSNSRVFDYVWILTVFPDHYSADILPSNNTTIALDVTDLLTTCGMDHVYIYDNASAFRSMLTSSVDSFVGSGYVMDLCGNSRQPLLPVLSRTGFLGIYYRSPLNPAFGSGSHRFYAQYAAVPADRDAISSSDATAVRPPFLTLAHSAVTCDDEKILYVLGRYPGGDEVSANLSFLWQYNISSESWRAVGGRNQASSSYYHSAAACVGKMLYVYGGVQVVTGADANATLRTVNTVLAYNVTSGTWQTPVMLGARLPDVAGHTVTVAATESNKVTLVAVGGYSTTSTWNPDVYVIFGLGPASARSLAAVQQETLGSAPRSLCFHTSVYHAASSTLYVHGGFQLNTYDPITNYYSTEPGASSSLYALRLATWRWDLLPMSPSATTLMPLSRYLHTAVDMRGVHMLVVGGMSSSSSYVQTAMLYNYACNTWTALPEKSANASLIPAVRQGVLVNRNGSLTVVTTAVRVITADCVLDQCVSNRSTAGYHTVVSPECNSPFPVCSKRLSCPHCLQSVTAPYASAPCSWATRASACSTYAPQDVSSSTTSTCFNDDCRLGSCEPCVTRGCIWTIGIKLQNDSHASLSSLDYTGTCLSKPVFMAAIQTAGGDRQSLYPPNSTWNVTSLHSCPAPCSRYTTALSCAAATSNHEGGPIGCLWSVALQMCMSYSMAMLACSRGECGSLVNSSTLRGALPCAAFSTSCSLCLSRPVSGSPAKCVWVTPPSASPGAAGGGYCTEVTKEVTRGNNTWYLQCPPSGDLCANPSLNTCNSTTEVCTQLSDTDYRCSCAPGYVLQKPGGSFYDASCVELRPWHATYGVCVPICSVPPAGGTGNGCSAASGCCAAPGVCSCKFGYVGADCSIKCNCNGHSSCLAHNTSACQCQHFTTGRFCETCLPQYVGNALNGGLCRSCLSLCSNRSNNCTQHFSLASNQASNVTCFSCQDYSDGPTCASCKPGYFLLSPNGTCTKCRCNGHSDVCDVTTGQCLCQNNTISLLSRNWPLWANQCNTCTKGYDGYPVNGRQCYSNLSAAWGSQLTAYCISAQGLLPCSGSPATPSASPSSSQRLPRGVAATFAVSPKYYNIDLRIVVDIINGSVDLLFTTNASAFVIKYNSTTNEHVVFVDEFKDPVMGGSASAAPVQAARSAARARRQAATYGSSAADQSTAVISDDPRIFSMSENTPVSYHTLILSNEVSNDYVGIKGLSRRAVFTFGHTEHDFASQRLYVVMIGRGLGGTSGLVVLRQDQVEINLFVFFAVFFAFVFKMLSFAAIILKFRQLRAIRRRQAQRQVELGQMASRPFATVMAHVMDDADGVCATAEQPLLGMRHGAYDRHGAAQHQAKTRSSFEVLPLAIEPLADGSHAVATVLVRLPGNACAPVRGCLGSVLVSVKNPVSASAPTMPLSKAAGRGRSTGPQPPGSHRSLSQGRGQPPGHRESGSQRRAQGRGRAQTQGQPGRAALRLPPGIAESSA